MTTTIAPSIARIGPASAARRAALAAACALVLVQAGCYGDLVSTRSEDPGGDPGGDDTGPDAAPIPGDVELVCAEPQTTTDDGHHYPGQACAGCHNGSIGPAFTVGGTLYADRGGAQAVAGVTVTLIDADQNRIDMVAAQNGNFWTDQPVSFPVTTFASSCPDLVPMSTVADSGDCNGCHSAGAAIAFAPQRPAAAARRSYSGGAQRRRNRRR